MLETHEERIRLLKKEFSGKHTNRDAVQRANGFKVVNTGLKEPRQV